jgi:hypothetical protein
MIIMIISMCVLILTLSNVIYLDCINWFSYAYLFPMSLMLIFSINSFIFGRLLIGKIKQFKITIQDSIHS